MSARASAIAGLALLLALANRPVRESLEAEMTTHMLVLLNGLAISGWFIGVVLRKRCGRINDVINPGGALGLTIALFASAFWMLPRALDESLRAPAMEAIKLVTIPTLVGFPLALSWPKFGGIFRSFLKANFISKLIALGWLYAAAPVQLCTSYLASDQQRFGLCLCALAIVLAILWSLPLFTNDHTTRTSGSIRFVPPEPAKS